MAEKETIGAIDLLPAFDYKTFAETVKSVDRRLNTFNFIEESLQTQNKALAAIKSGSQEELTDLSTSPSLLNQKQNQYAAVETEFREHMLKAHEKKREDIMASAIKFTLQEQARATGEADAFLDPYFEDMDISKLSNLQNYNNVIYSKKLEYIRNGYTDDVEIDEKIHGYLSERVSPMVADVMMGKEDSTDERQRRIIDKWLHAKSTISSAIPELVDVLEGADPYVKVPGLSGRSTLQFHPTLTEEEKIEYQKLGLMWTEVGVGLATIPATFGASGSLVAGAIGMIDIGLGVPAVLRGKDPLQELVLGTEKADELNMWQKAFYAVPGLMGAYPAVKTTGKLSKTTYDVLKNKYGQKQASEIISQGKASTELALSKVFGTPEWDELKELAETGIWKEGKLGLAQHIELSDMIEDIEKGTSRLPNELLMAHSRANNPISGIAQKAALGDTEAIKNIYNIVKRANANPLEKLPGDVNPMLILNNFTSVETRNVAKEIVEDMNKVKPSVKPRPSKASDVFGD